MYAGNGSLSQFDNPCDREDRKESPTIGSRTGWLIHSNNQATCVAVLPSEQGIATVQVDLTLALTDQRYDQ
ncbi:hypothetical protein BKG76_00335 [Mycobacteroides franklinii]|uniref:DUF3558 domain-containing protein n=1 Tax=Mycobacteroides franklinii TaxID=948102 RepID=A0A1S1LF59_9MYCO|nr:hypothetical protein BKG76_00335 [Mycobacteroides franklinii]